MENSSLSKIAITGPSGMVGSSIIKKFSENNIEVHPINKDAIVNSSEMVIDLLKKKQISTLIHTASPIFTSNDTPETSTEKYNSLIRLDEKILDIAHRVDMQNLINLSTSLIYGDTKGDRAKESSYFFHGKLDSRKHLYILGKRKTLQNILETNQPNWFSIILPNLISRNSKHLHFIEKIIDDIKTKRGLNENFFLKNGYIQFLRVEDFVSWLYYLLVNFNDFSNLEVKILNIGPKWVTTTHEVMSELLNLFGLPLNETKFENWHQSSLIDSTFAAKNFNWKTSAGPRESLFIEFFQERSHKLFHC